MHLATAAGASSRPSPTLGRSHRNFFLPTTSMEVIEATTVETYLFPAGLQELRK